MMDIPPVIDKPNPIRNKKIYPIHYSSILVHYSILCTSSEIMNDKIDVSRWTKAKLQSVEVIQSVNLRKKRLVDLH